MIHRNEAGLQVPEPSIRERFRLLARVFKWFFRPNMYHSIHDEIDEYGRIVISGWIRTAAEQDYRYHYVTYDGKTTPHGYIDGLIITEQGQNVPLRIGKVIEIEQT